MSLKIHPKAKIHPSAILEGDVEIGEGTVVGPFVYILGPVVIGSHNQISSHVVIGEEPEHRSKKGQGWIRIGDHNSIREYVAIQRSTGETDTEIGDHCYLMDRSQIAHDCVLEDHVTFSSHVILGGHCRVLEGATLGIGTMAHQWSTIGSYTMTGMGSVITKDIFPFALVKGNPARYARWNTHVFAKLGIVESQIRFSSGRYSSSNPTADALFERFYQFQKRTLLSV